MAGGPVSVEVAAGADDRDGMLREARAWAASPPTWWSSCRPARPHRGGARLRRRTDRHRRRTCPSARAGAGGAQRGGGPLGAGRARRGRRRQRRDPQAGRAVPDLRRADRDLVAAAIRIPTDVIDAALAGAHAAAAPAAVLRELDAESSRQANGRADGARHAHPPARQPAQIGPARHRGRPAGRGRPGRALEVELGSAEAHFLIDCASADRHHAVRRCRDPARAGRRDQRSCAPRPGITNVRSVFANMSVDMGRLFADGSVRRFFLNFPDPWFKSRQHKRRVIGPGLHG